MTAPQWLSIATLAATMALFIWGRLRYDLVAMLGLLAGIAVAVLLARALIRSLRVLAPPVP